MQVHINKTDTQLTIRVLVEKTEPEAARFGVLYSGVDAFFEYTDKDWESSETPTQVVLEQVLPLIWAADAVIHWLNRMAREVGYRLALEAAGRKTKIDPDSCRYPNIELFLDGTPVANELELKQALVSADQVWPIGSLQLASGTVRVSDPCYSRDTWCTLTFNALPGTWLAQSLIGPTTWSQRVKALRIRHETAPEEVFSDANLAAFENIGSAGVDSGQCGFFDEALYPADDAELKKVKGTFYNNCCELTLSRALPGGGAIEREFGVVTESGFGDGSYSVLVHRNTAGQAIAAVLQYIDDTPSDEDDEDDYEDEDSPNQVST